MCDYQHHITSWNNISGNKIFYVMLMSFIFCCCFPSTYFPFHFSTPLPPHLCFALLILVTHKKIYLFSFFCWFIVVVVAFTPTTFIPFPQELSFLQKYIYSVKFRCCGIYKHLFCYNCLLACLLGAGLSVCTMLICQEMKNHYLNFPFI